MSDTKRLTPTQRAFLLGYRRAKARRRAERREIEDWLEHLHKADGEAEALADGDKPEDED